MKSIGLAFIIMNLLIAPAWGVGRIAVTHRIEKVSQDTSDVKKLLKKAEDHYESAPDSSAYFAGQAAKTADQIRYNKGAADARIRLAKVYAFNGRHAAADSLFRNALARYKKENSLLGESEAYLGLGGVQDYLGHYKAALDYYNKALQIRKKLGNELETANAYAVIGITYDNMGQFTKALDNYFKSLNIDLKLNEQLLAADNYCNIGVVMQHLELWQKALDYFNKAATLWNWLDDKQGISTINQNIGEVMMSLKNYAGAEAKFRKALNIYLKLGDKDGISLVYYDLGMVKYHQSQPDSALYYLNESLKSALQNNITYNAAYAYEGLSTVYNLEKRYSEALSSGRKAQAMGKSLQSINLEADAALQVSKALAGLRNFEEAYGQHQWYLTLRDSLKNSETLQKFASYNMAVDFENNQRKAALKEAELTKKLREQRITNAIYIFIIAVAVVMLGIYYNEKRKQVKANALLAEKNKEITNQAGELNDLNNLKDRLIGILAHDLRAPISTLRGMFTLLTDKDITYTEFIEMVPSVFSKLEHTSDFLDTLLFWINSQVDDIKETAKSFCLSDIVKTELEILQDQLKSKKITVHNNVNSGHYVMADPNCIRIVVHNFLTNAIKFSHDDSAIQLQAYFEADDVCFVIRDSGIGISDEQLQKLFKRKVESHPGTRNERGTGMGLIFCKDLIEKYNGRIWAKSNPGDGTELGFCLKAAPTPAPAQTTIPV